jgi:hypothetical protein
MSFPYPTFISIDYRNEIECEQGKLHSISRILPEDIDSLVLTDAGKAPSKAEKQMVCEVVSGAFVRKY